MRQSFSGLAPTHWRFEPGTREGILPAMSTLTEIENAIETLHPSQVEQLAAWLRQRRSGDAHFRHLPELSVC